MSDSMNNTAAAAATYKKLKEEFVSGLSGGTVSEICYVTLVAPVSVLLWSVLQSRQSFFRPFTPLGFVVDFLLNVGAILLAITLYSGAPLLLNGLLLAAALFVYALPPSAGGRRKKPRLPPPQSQAAAAAQAKSAVAGAGRDVLPLKPFLTTYRGCMLVITALAILAVDFRLFPRRFAKVETWGTSLMDIGVGSFVFAAGLVAARPVLKERAAAGRGGGVSLGRRLLASARHAVPLLVLGVVRLLSVKGLDYAEHVTEYGVHWNFFFTLGLLPPFVAASQSALRLVRSHAALALALAAAYQVALETTSLKAYILTAPRTDLLSMNREGVFSFCGYLAIFLAGQDAGMYILPRRGGESRTRLPLTIAAWSAAWVALYLLATDYRYGAGLSTSRRLANLPYVLGVVSFNMVQMLAFCLIDGLCFPASAGAAAADPKVEKEAYETATSRVLRAYNRNGLFVFLVANLLTGLVNMTVPTLDVGPVATMGILVAYAAGVTGVAVGLDMYDISIKL